MSSMECTTFIGSRSTSENRERAMTCGEDPELGLPTTIGKLWAGSADLCRPLAA